MKLKITKEIQKQFPNLKIGVVVAHDVTNRKSDSVLEQFKREAENNLQDSEWTSGRLLEHPFIASWRDPSR